MRCINKATVCVFLLPGPSVLEVFHALLRHLRMSIDTQVKNEAEKAEEKKFQEAIINTIGRLRPLAEAFAVISDAT